MGKKLKVKFLSLPWKMKKKFCLKLFGLLIILCKLYIDDVRISKEVDSSRVIPGRPSPLMKTNRHKS